MVTAQLRMEGRGEKMALTDEYRIFVAGGEYFHLRSGLSDAGGADEDHLEGGPFKFGRCGEDGGIDLSAICVSLDGDIKGGKRFLGRVFDTFGEEDGAGAGAEGRRGLDEGLERVKEIVTLEKFEHGGGLTAGHDEAVDTFEVGREADEFRRRAECTQRFGVGFVCALQSEHTYSERPRGH